jgi:hydrogenase maturation protease
VGGAVAPTLVVGVGNVERGDDGVGPLVARLLAGSWADDPPAGVEVVAWGGDPLGLLDLWAGRQRLLLIDAVVTGAAAGTCRRFATDAPFRSDAASTHGLGLAAALALARALDRAPARVEVWGIEGASFEPGAPLTPAVAAAALDLAARLRRDLAGRG